MLRNKCQRQSSLSPHVDCINKGEEDEMELYGYRKDAIRVAVTWLFILLTVGALRLVFHWWPHLMLLATHKKCKLPEAEKVLVVEKYLKYRFYYVKTVHTLIADYRTLEKMWDKQFPENWDDHALADVDSTSDIFLSVHHSGGTFKEYRSIRMFKCKKLCYVWNEEHCQFLRLAGLDKEVTTSALHQQTGLSFKEHSLRRLVYGSNEIIIPVQGIITLLFLEILNPFYVFQLFSFCLWFADNYMYYALAILAMSAFGIIMAIRQTRKNQFKLRSTVCSSDVAVVIRKDKAETIPTAHLVPGDVVIIPAHGCIMPCDAVLLAGTCIVNESMLTGESVPVTKTPVPNTQGTLYDSKEHARHTLFCGTHIIQTRYFGNETVRAVVIRTGFSTAKGSLVRSIMYPPPVDFKFERDSYRFVELLAGIASIGFVYTVITKFMRGISWSDIALDSLDLITIVVPPALPAAMTVGRFYAQSRLEKKGVYCISPRAINVSGSVDCVCFDKTGTLTEDGLDMWGLIPVEEKKFQVPVKFIDQMAYDHFIFGMVSCHSITIIDGKLNGDPLDLKMFESTGWELEEPEVSDDTKYDMLFPTVLRPPKNDMKSLSCDDLENVADLGKPPLEVGIVRQFPFSSSLQRMSVIARILGKSSYYIYCKGSPEMIISLSDPQTVPSDFTTVLEEYTQEGYRVLALAYRELPKISYAKLQRITREEVETDLKFVGLIIMENRLKIGTASVLTMLRDANIRCIMVTGDNMLTALSVARDCGIIPCNQQVIVASSYSTHNGQSAHLHFMHINNRTQSPDMNTVNSSVTKCTSLGSLESIESGSVNISHFGALDEDPNHPVLGKPVTDYSFVMTGKTWSSLKTCSSEVTQRLVTRCAVFARMSPDQKQQLVQELQQLGYYVAMCGDGANDCGALKAAHAGISLSEAESSVASPFTSKNADISCVPHVIREGRAALVTSFGIFKYMAAYSLTQFVTVMILYSIESNLTDIEFLYIDLFLITVFAFFFGRIEAYDGPLAKSPPILSLISFSPILSLMSQVGFVIFFQCISFYAVHQTEWFEPYNATAKGENNSLACYENYALFSVSSLQYIILALVFSKGAPYRKSVLNSWGYCTSLIVLTVCTLYLIIGPTQWLADKLDLRLPPVMSFRFVMVGIGFANLVLSCFFEYFIVDYVVFRKLRFMFHDVNKSRRKYLAIERDLAKDISWPPISSTPIHEPVINTAVSVPRSPATVAKISFQQSGIHRSDDIKEVTLDPSSLMSPKQSVNNTAGNSCVLRPNEKTDGGVSLSSIVSTHSLQTVNSVLQPTERTMCEVHESKSGL
ncbi:polyamine-transporting ATPase 13A3 isoform X2 [Bacillus rossius redtenbacheri]|uniref:polyamine-transporting ATPase 13A3 isoform X2 n=1 Tax=Bacillus rossius redtenbacheri TaxID=93214 RepID=UPI002FDE75BE